MLLHIFLTCFLINLNHDPDNVYRSIQFRNIKVMGGKGGGLVASGVFRGGGAKGARAPPPPDLYGQMPEF